MPLTQEHLQSLTLDIKQDAHKMLENALNGEVLGLVKLTETIKFLDAIRRYEFQMHRRLPRQPEVVNPVGEQKPHRR